MLGDELRALRVPKRPSLSFPRGVHRFCTVSGLAKLIERAGIAAKIGFKVHPNMLRHAAVIELQRRQLASPAHCGVCWRKQTRRLRTPDPPPLAGQAGGGLARMPFAAGRRRGRRSTVQCNFLRTVAQCPKCLFAPRPPSLNLIAIGQPKFIF